MNNSENQKGFKFLIQNSLESKCEMCEINQII